MLFVGRRVVAVVLYLSLVTVVVAAVLQPPPPPPFPHSSLVFTTAKDRQNTGINNKNNNNSITSHSSSIIDFPYYSYDYTNPQMSRPSGHHSVVGDGGVVVQSVVPSAVQIPSPEDLDPVQQASAKSSSGDSYSRVKFVKAGAKSMDDVERLLLEKEGTSASWSSTHRAVHKRGRRQSIFNVSNLVKITN